MRSIRRVGLLIFMMCSFYFGCVILFFFVTFDGGNSNSNLKQVKPAGGSDDVLTVVILSSPHNFSRRKIIRGTWLNLHLINKVASNWLIENNTTLKCFFVIGTKDLENSLLHDIEREKMKHKDILLLHDFKDSYKELSKKVLLSFKWVLHNVRNVQYILKCDDDSFVRLDLLPQEVDKIKRNKIDSKYIRPQYPKTMNNYYENYIYWGYFYGNAKVYSSGQWSDSSWFLCDKYLPYALGGGYLLSIDIVKHIVSNMNILRLYASEDVSVGTWTAGFDINRIHDERFDTQWTSRGCDNSYLIRHKQSTKNMQKAFLNLVQSNFTKMCSQETLQRKSYKYDWDVLPSQCCLP